ncbi:MAG TPA: AAA family ATPase [Thermomicrobiales bacterium]|nr:AAA family ATPase [Thermomicrobiales bacterium]
MASSILFGNQHPIVGREQEQLLLRHQLERSLDGHGSLVLVRGEAGIGKTALVEDLMRTAAAHGAIVLAGHCYDLSTTPPYGPWGEIFGRHTSGDGLSPSVPAIFRADEPGQAVQSQMAFFEEIKGFFASMATRSPVVLVLEDLHWSDPASLELLRYLARQLRDSRLVIIATYRDKDVSHQHPPLFELIPLLVREAGASRIDLQPLSEAATQTWVAARYCLPDTDTDRLVSYLRQYAEGNPLFIGEILRSLESEGVLGRVVDGWMLDDLGALQVPSLVLQMIERRLASLDSVTRRALELAAIAGYETPLELWSAESTLSDEALDAVVMQALDADILRETPDSVGFRFSHPLVREALYAQIPLPRRRVWHRQMGEALAAMPNTDPDAVAHHFQQARDPRAAEWLVRAGLRAERRHALLMAAKHYQTALELFERDDAHAQARGWLLNRIGRLLRYVQPERSLDYLEAAGKVAAEIDDPLLAAYSLTDRRFIRCFSGNLEHGLADLQAGVAAVDALSAADRARTQNPLVTLIPDLVDLNVDTLAGGLAMPGILPGVNRCMHPLIPWLAFSGRFTEARAMGEAYVASVTAADNRGLENQIACRDAYQGLVYAYTWLGQPDLARHWIELARSAYQRIGHYAVLVYLSLHELQLLLSYQTEQVAHRRNSAQAVVELAPRIDESFALAHPAFEGAHILEFVEGRWSKARELALAGRAASMHVILRPWAMSVLGTLARSQGQPIEAWEQVYAALPSGPDTKPGDVVFFHAVELQRLAVDLALDDGDLEAARIWLQAHDRWLKWSNAVLGQAEGHLCWARYHQIAGDVASARTHAEQALAHATMPRQPLALLAAHRLLGLLDILQRHYDAAQVQLDASLIIVDACAAPYEKALTLLAMAELRAATGDTTEAKRLAGQVRLICESLGAQPALDRTRALFERLGIETPDGYPIDLTRREVEVLRLIAAGQSNRQIAMTLSISARTVERHIENLYRKVDAHNRADATAFALRHHLA